MTEFTTHSLESAPAASRPFLNDIQKKMGFIPNLASALAESPATLQAYLSLSEIFDTSRFTETEKQLILLTISRIETVAIVWLLMEKQRN